MGFRLMGGRDQGQLLHIASITPRGLAQKLGLRPGDGILKIGMVPAVHLNHDQAKAEILRSGNELHFWIKRGAVPEAMVAQELGKTETARAVVDEEPTHYRGDPNPKKQSRCFRILTEALVEEMHDIE